MSIDTITAPSRERFAGGLNKSAAHFARPSGPDLLARTETYYGWVEARRRANVWPYERAVAEAPRARTTVISEGSGLAHGVNLASTDYLGLASHPEVIEAGVVALKRFGPHSASSGILLGNSSLSRELESVVADTLHMSDVVLFPTGWSAGFGTIVGLVRPSDHVVMDALAHASLQQGARAATQNVQTYGHLDDEGLRERLAAIREKDTRNAILVVSEGIYSMNSDSPDIPMLQSICREFGATLLLDVAHDFGAMGANGGGQIELQNMLGQVDLVVGAFSKALATNGGFLATRSSAVAAFVKACGSSYTFTNALSPVQAGIALKAIEIARSNEGERLRERLRRNTDRLRSEIRHQGLGCLGMPSAIVPVPIGSEKVARIASGLLFERNVFANLAEFPAVSVGASRFRMQVMSTHSEDELRHAAAAVAASIREAVEILGTAEPQLAVVRERI